MRFVELPSGQLINLGLVRKLQPERSYRLEWIFGNHELLGAEDGKALAAVMRTGVNIPDPTPASPDIRGRSAGPRTDADPAKDVMPEEKPKRRRRQPKTGDK